MSWAFSRRSVRWRKKSRKKNPLPRARRPDHGGRHLYDHEAQDKLARGDDPLSFDNLYAVERVRDSIRLRDVPTSMLIIAGSGMCNGGRIVGHLKELLPCAETCVLFVGYQAPGTPGRAIQDASHRGARVRLDGEEIDVRAHIETLSGLSAHAEQRELVRWAAALPEPRKVALHHGEPGAQRALAIALAQHREGLAARTRVPA